MSKMSVRALTGIALGVIITAGLWAAFAAGHRDRVDAALQHASAEASVTLQRALLEIDLAGAEARDALLVPSAFDAVASRFEGAARDAARRDGAGPGLRLIGVAELRLRADGWTPRGARIAEAGAENAGVATEALRIGAIRAAELTPPPDRATGRVPPPLLLAVGEDRPRLWIVWREDAAGAAFAALVELPMDVASLGLRGFDGIAIGPLRLDGRDAPAAATDRLGARIVVSLGGASAEIPVSADPPGVFALDRAVTGPMSVFAALIFGALFVLARSQRRRDDEVGRRQRAIIESIAAKQTALDESEARFRHLAESTNVIPWRADLDANRFTYVGPQIEGLTGHPASTWRAEGFWLQHVYAKDRQRVRQEAAEKAREGGYFTLEYRIRDAKGELLHISNMLSVAKTAREEGGHALTAQGFMLDVTARIRAEEELQRAHDAAERANNFKSAFLATMSHELRTPLNAVIGFSEIMKDELFGPLDPQYKDYAASVHASGKHLLKLINDILDLSKIEAGRFELHEEPTDVVELLEECKNLMQQRIANAGLETRLEIDPATPTVLIDERRIKQVILNLLSNAIKFTPEGGEVALVARRRPGQGVAISVRDSGIGMAEEEIPRALENFGQIDGELSRRHDGTGLGLPIARSLTQLHGGDLKIESALGVGTEIFVLLPESRIVGPSVAAAPG